MNEFDEITETLNRNSLVMYHIKEMKVENVMFSSDKVKIDKKDFEKLRDSALKAYTQHNLYATVKYQLERLEKDKEYYKRKSEKLQKEYSSLRNKKYSEIYKLEKLLNRVQDVFKYASELEKEFIQKLK